MINVKIDSFEGPLDLLLHLIQKAEVDIYDISISEITDQYVAFIRAMHELELDVASEFLVMASTLLAIKSHMLLPQNPDLDADAYDMEEDMLDPRQELIERLLEYKKYKHLAQQLRENESKQQQLYSRAPENLSAYIETEETNPVLNVSLYHLLDAFQYALERNKEDPIQRIEREEISIEERMQQMRDYLSVRGKVSFSHLLQDSLSRYQIVITFLALLEMMKNHQVTCTQESIHADIWISRTQEGDKHVL